MMISTKGRYALRVLIDMAEHQKDGYIPLKEIARRQEISEKYLESIIKLLVKDQVLEGLRGKGGGYPPVRGAGSAHRRGRAAADGGVARARSRVWRRGPRPVSAPPSAGRSRCGRG